MKWQSSLHSLNAASELEKSKNKAEKSHSAPSAQCPGLLTGCLMNIVFPRPLVKPHGNSAPGMSHGEPAQLTLELPHNLEIEKRSHTNSPCTCRCESLESCALSALPAFAFSAPLFSYLLELKKKKIEKREKKALLLYLLIIRLELC